MNKEENIVLATFAAGCFWCVEAVFQKLNGVLGVQSGYSGGVNPNPTYKEVCTGETGHAEVCQIKYDSNIISFEELLEVFFKVHDPTSLNKQGGDIGTQYRSSVFYHSDSQKEITQEIIQKLNDSGAYTVQIVTLLEPYKEFYAAEDYHNNYFNLNGNQPYCAMVVKPKVDKFEKIFKDKLKT
jgi:peptide-methionine (S)-S-oxide reductase